MSERIDADHPQGASAVLTISAGRGLRGVSAIFLRSPGMIAVAATYGIVAGLLYGHPYPNLWGAVGATAVGVTWYLSPLRRLGAGRGKNHLKSATPA